MHSYFSTVGMDCNGADTHTNRYRMFASNPKPNAALSCKSHHTVTAACMEWRGGGVARHQLVGRVGEVGDASFAMTFP